MDVRRFYGLIFSSFLIPLTTFSQNNTDSCRFAFNYFFDENTFENAINICFDTENIPFRYEAEVNLPVCDDTLCANAVLEIYWDLAGNYTGFDTIKGFPLTKFDHIKFTTEDYTKMDQILKNKNSMLRILDKEELVDKSVKIKSKTVDAVTGATPQTIKKSVVDGAVYSSYTIWHFVNGPIKNSMANYTQRIYSGSVSRRLLLSDNYETQLFALKKWSDNDYNIQSDLLFQIIRKSVPLIKANAILKTPLPFDSAEKNKKFVSLFPELDDYSKSIFMNRVMTEKNVAEVFLPLIISDIKDFNKKQVEQIAAACQKFEIEGFDEIFLFLNNLKE